MMKQAVKDTIKKLPGMRGVAQKIENYKCIIGEREKTIMRLALANIDYRLREKKSSGKKINVLFLCWRPAVWESLHSIYDALKSDERFSVKIIAIPNKKQLPKVGLSHEFYESEGAEEFWKGYGCINGYDYENKKWVDLKDFEPDYIFIQQPYNVARAPQYNSFEVSQYAKICYVSYFNFVVVDSITEECLPLDFLKNVSFFFTQNEIDQRFVEARMKLSGNETGNTILTGFPRYDGIKNFMKSESEMWNERKTGTLRIVWTPRWTTNEGNCHFFDYKDRLVDFCKGNPDFDFVFRPHPQAFKEWAATGELTEENAEIYKKNFTDNANMHIDESNNYYPMLYSSDCLITDRSSIVMEYFVTGKPIIYCSKVAHPEEIDLIGDGLYYATCWDELVAHLKRLQKGNDELLGVRKDIIGQSFFMPAGGAGNMIKEIIAKDAFK